MDYDIDYIIYNIYIDYTNIFSIIYKRLFSINNISIIRDYEKDCIRSNRYYPIYGIIGDIL